ncbi:MAG TPA: VOC family protein, partial [Actinomycetota bacterium]|nr:VOC family protein [Actinomycetota bacterium]
MRIDEDGAMSVDEGAMSVQEGATRVGERRMRVEHASKIGACLWFDDQAEEAADFYVTVFSARRA